jgi:hypothetical protein
MEILISTAHERIFAVIFCRSSLRRRLLRLFLLHGLNNLDCTACLRILLRNSSSNNASSSKSIAALTELQS